MSKNQPDKKIVFLIQCIDSKGILSKVSSFFYNLGFNILSCQQFTDTVQDKYYMRVSLDGSDLSSTRKFLESKFSILAKELGLSWSVRYTEDLINVGILVSKTSHCLFDLLEKQSEGKLKCKIPLIISNHPDLEYIADRYKIPFYCLPLNGKNANSQQEEIVSLLKKHHINLIVLARYMRILSNEFIEKFPEQIINIHHAFLPAFKGANPYRRAYDRGVKMIGATAHYATNDLDEGPIIEQDVERVSHASSPTSLAKIGADIERKVLSKAISYHIDNRVIVTDNKTIVFPESNE